MYEQFMGGFTVYRDSGSRQVQSQEKITDSHFWIF